MKRFKLGTISGAETAILTAAFATLVLALLASLFLAQRQLVETAQYWDFLRVERYIQLCQMALESEAKAMPTEASIQKLRDIGLYLDVYPPDTEIPEPNPRYVHAIGSVEGWGYIRDPEGKPAAVIRLSRHDINTRHTMQTVRLYTLAGGIGGILLIGVIGLMIRKTIINRIGRMIREIEENLPHPPQTRAKEPLERLEQGVREALGAGTQTAARTQKLLDGHSELACLESLDCTLLEANAAYCRLFGKTREELVGSNYLDLIPPSDRSDVLTSLRRLSRRSPVNVVEHRVLLPDGGLRWMRWRDHAVFDDSDNVIEVLSFGTDITAEKELEAQLRGLQLAFDQMQSLAQTGSLVWDLTSDRMEWTDETYRLLGIERGAGEPNLETLLAKVAARDSEALRAHFVRARENGTAFEQEFRATLPDGSHRILQTRAEVRADPKTKLLSLLTCTLRDISSLREAEASIRRELRFREAIETSLAAGIVVSDDQGRNIFVNPAFCEMTGWPKEELFGASAPYPYWPEEETPAIVNAFDSTLAGRTPPQGYELRFCRKDGTRFDVLIKVAPLLDSDDKRLGWLAVVSDISSIQQTRRELLQAEAAARQELLYRQAIEKSTTVGLIAIDQNGRPISINEAYCKMLGYSKEEIMAMSPPYPFWPDEERKQIEEAFALHLAGQTPPGGFTLRFLKKDGTPIDLLITAAPIHDAQGAQIGVLSVLTDITPLQEAQRQLRTANERLRIAQDVAEFGIWDWDPLNNTLHWDRQSFALFGHPDATDAHEVWSKIHSEETQEQLTYEIERLIAEGGQSGQDRIHAQWPDGTNHEVLSTYIIMRDEAGKAVRVLGVNRDITAEVEEERELRNANERLAVVLEGGQFGTFEHIIGLGDVNWSAANYEINGIDPSITDPDKLFAVWKQGAGSFFPELMARMEALPVDENHLTYEFTARPPGREPRRVRTSVFIERNKQGHPVRLVGITRRVD